MSDKQDGFMNIFDFITDTEESIEKNISSGNIVFKDKVFEEFDIPPMFTPFLSEFKKLKDLKYFKVEEIIKRIKKNYKNKFQDYITYAMRGREYCENNLERIINNLDNVDVLLKRIEGAKLSEIGTSRSVTRERIRQIENSLIEEIDLYIISYINLEFLDGKYENLQFYNFAEIFDFIKDEKIIKIIEYCISFKKEYLFAIYNDDFNVFINVSKKEKIKEIKDILKLEKYFNYYDTFSKINNTLIYQHNIEDFSIDIYLNYLKNNNYLFKGNLAYIFGECSVNEIVSMVIRDYYPNGILLDDKGRDNLSTFITELLNYPFKVSSALAKIDEFNDELILWGKLQRIHIDNIKLSNEQIDLIVSKFKMIVEEVDYLLFEDAFNAMQDVLENTTITDKYKLYGIIKYYLNTDFYFKKMAVRKLELKNQTLSDLVYDYIDKHDMCTKDEIVAELFIAKSSLFAVYRDKVDIICTETYHTLISKLSITDEFIEEMKVILSKEILNTFVHRDILFEKYKELISKNNIVDSTMLYHICRYYFEKDYTFMTPYIQSLKYDKPVTLKNIILDIFEKNNNIVSINDITEEVSSVTASKDFSLVYNLRISDIKVFRINKEDIALASTIEVEDIVKYMINNRLKEHFKNECFALTKDLKELAKGLYYHIDKKKYYMNYYSLCSFIENNYSEYNVLSSSGINNYSDANYAVSNKYDSFLDVAYHILKENSKNNIIDRKYAMKLLKSKELFSSIPQYFINEKYIKIEEEQIILLK